MQLSFPAPDLHVADTLHHDSFSHDGVCPDEERLAIEQRYAALLEESEAFNRRLVSFQGNKQSLVHSWIKYREGFSADLVETLARRMGLQPGTTLLDPFSGSATTLLVARTMGLDAVGVELLPSCHLMWDAKARLGDYHLAELQGIWEHITHHEVPTSDMPFSHLTITAGAFAPETERALMGYREWLESARMSEESRVLLRLVLMGVLEEISFTRKDGQYLRWDARSSKVQERNASRAAKNQEPIRPFDKGEISTVQEAFSTALNEVIKDIRKLQKMPLTPSDQRLLKGNVLEWLPQLEPEQFDGVITSPPYCNRYDYTRTYALELAYLDVGEDGVRDLRQGLLSCTVENRPKVAQLRASYAALDALLRFEAIYGVVQRHPALNEVNKALQMRWERQEINNKGILTMVEGYFTEMAFIIAELHRVCRSGAQVAIVNDNVRYGGEVIPVDLLSTDLAVAFGFEPVQVIVLPQRKGNSSQQMGRFGRVPLRKSITLWRRP